MAGIILSSVFTDTADLSVFFLGSLRGQCRT